MYRILIGEISEERKKNWNNGDDNPFDVIAGKPLHEKTCYVSDVCVCQKHLRDEVAVDWASWAWKGNTKEIEELFRELKWDFGSKCTQMDSEKDYAVVFIEDVM